MNKGTAIVGFFMSFLAGMFLMWGLDKGKAPTFRQKGERPPAFPIRAAPACQ